MITIVTDSSACLKRADAMIMGVEIVPMGYTVNGRPYFESYSDQNGDFESISKYNSVFSTSQPNPAAFLSCFEEELAKGNEVLCITISSRLSGTYSAAHAAAKQAGSDKVAVFDSHLTAGGLHLLIKKACELIRSGLALEELTEKLAEIRNRITIAFSVDDIAPLRRSGRIGLVRMSVGTILNKKPVLLLNEGIVVSCSIARGDADAVKKLARLVSNRAEEIIINYIGNSRLATNLYNVLKSAEPSVPISLSKLGPVLGIHLGFNVIAVAFIT